MIKTFKPSLKQYQALMYLGAIPMSKIVKRGGVNMRESVLDENGLITYDYTTTQIGYGGAAGGGKSRIGTQWLSMVARRFPGTRWYMARQELKRLKSSTLLTLFESFQDEGLMRDVDYIYNDIAGKVTIINDIDNRHLDSTIMLLGLEFLPSDPMYTRFGSMEFSGGFIDESNECEEAGFDILNTRIRYKLEDFCPYCAGSISFDNNFVRVDTIENIDQCDHDDKYIEKNLYLCPTCGRYTYGLSPKNLCSFNPDKGRVYQKFYKPWREGNMPSYVKFIPALATDNPYLPKAYIHSLKKLKDKVMKERLLYGNFEYDNTPGRLYEYDDLLSMFGRETETEILERKYLEEPKQKAIVDKFGRCYLTGYEYKIVSDPARHGRDFAVIMVRNKFSVEEIIVYFKSDIPDLEKEVIKIWDRLLIGPKETLVDEDGVGGGLKDILHCRGFLNNASPIQSKKAKRDALDRANYQNLKTQCYFELRNHIDKIAVGLSKIKIVGGSLSEEDIRKRIIEELDIIVEIDIDKDGPKKIINKKDIKEKLKRSPDFGDCFCMRMLWEVKSPIKAYTYS